MLSDAYREGWSDSKMWPNHNQPPGPLSISWTVDSQNRSARVTIKVPS